MSSSWLATDSSPTRSRAPLRARGLARRRTLLADPEYRARFTLRVSQASGGRVTAVCIVCGSAFEVPPSWRRRGYGKTYSQACHEQWSLQRGRACDGRSWQEVAEQLRALGPASSVGLDPLTLQVLRLFYELEDGVPWTQGAIGKHLGLSRNRVQHILTSAPVVRLLGEPGRSAHRRVAVACAVCGAAVVRTRPQQRDRVQTTCSTACLKELQRRRVPRLSGDAATNAKRLDHLRQRASSPEHPQKMRSVAMQRSRPHAAALKALPAEAFDTLLPADRDVVCHYYGLDDDRPKTLAQLAAAARQGKTRVRQRIVQAVARLLQLRMSVEL